MVISVSSVVNVHGGFPGGSAGKESTCNAGDWGLIAGLGRSPGEGNGYPLQYVHGCLLDFCRIFVLRMFHNYKLTNTYIRVTRWF